MSVITLESIEEARRRVSKLAVTTHLVQAPWLDSVAGNSVYLKPENLQVTGSFKIRGASNLLLSMVRDVLEKGVITASSGNHGLGVAYAGSKIGCPVEVVVPEGCLSVKRNGIESYGARVTSYGRSSNERRAYAREQSDREGYIFVHSHDDPLIIAGQGTIGLEIYDELPEAGAVIVPVGGGGLISGIAVALKNRRPGIKLYGVEPEKGCCMRNSLIKGEIIELDETPRTMADGLRGTRPGRLPFDIVMKYVDDILTVSEDSILRALKATMSEGKLVVEPSGAVVIAALMDGSLPPCPGSYVAVISGGNIDARLLKQIVSNM